MLENMTGGRLRSTIHRVLDHGEERMSAPFFLEPGWDKELCGKYRRTYLVRGDLFT